MKHQEIKVGALHERLKRLAEAGTSEAIAEVLQAEAAALGYSSFIYALRIPTSFADARIVQVKGYRDDWLDRYWTESYYEIDPVIEYCSHHILPIGWKDLVPRMSAAGQRMMNEASDFGLRDGISVPTHGPRGELGILSFARKRRGASRAATAHALCTAQLVGGYAHEAVRRIGGVTKGTPHLSTREEDCLRWAAEGKTSWEISQLFNISERTVNFHFDNSVTKLEASNRQHAIAKAILSRILRPRPF